MTERSPITLTEDDLRKLVPLDDHALAAARRTFMALGRGEARVPPVLSLHLPEVNGEIDVKTAHVAGIDRIAIKISPGFFNNPDLGLPSLSGLMVVLDAGTGLLSALLLDNGYLTNIRTAASGAVATDLLANPKASNAAILGAGLQAELQARTLVLVRPVERLRIWARRMEQAEALCDKLMADGIANAEPLETVERAVEGAQIVITTTPAQEPLLPLRLVEPGMHITAIGSDAAYKNEIDPHIISKAAVYAPDIVDQCRKIGELRAARDAGLSVGTERLQTVGDIAVGKAAGRQSDDAITVADLTGTGAADTVIADMAIRAALQTPPASD